jgi:hypothetical protein
MACFRGHAVSFKSERHFLDMGVILRSDVVPQDSAHC